MEDATEADILIRNSFGSLVQAWKIVRSNKEFTKCDLLNEAMISDAHLEWNQHESLIPEFNDHILVGETHNTANWKMIDYINEGFGSNKKIEKVPVHWTVYNLDGIVSRETRIIDFLTIKDMVDIP
jgi:hypothetical protein